MSRKRKRSREPTDPYAVGSIHTARVDALDGHPAAVGTITTEGVAPRQIRIPGGAPGDQVEVEVVARGRRDVWTRIVEVVRAGPQRVTPPCPVVHRCGACPWQAVRYRDQLAAKGRRLRETLRARPALAEAVIHDPEGISPPVEYRTKVQMPVGGSAGALELGFWAPRSHDFVAAPTCVVQHPAAERVRHRILQVLDSHALAPWDDKNGQGVLRTLLVRVAAGTGEVGAVLVVSDFEAYEWELLAAELTSITELTGVWVNENDTPGNAVLGRRTVHLAGARRLRDRIAGVTFHRNPAGFFQTNHRATERLVAKVNTLLPERMRALLDLYAGGGLFSVLLAPRADHVHLVESHPDAVAAARATLRDAGVEHATIHLGRAETRLPALAAEGQALDAAVVDPPRAGMAPEAAAALCAMAPERVVYVSCSMRSMVRDLERLCASGYRLREVHAVDMFPHTPHVETVSLLTLPATAKGGVHGR